MTTTWATLLRQMGNNCIQTIDSPVRVVVRMQGEMYFFDLSDRTKIFPRAEIDRAIAFGESLGVLAID